MLSLMYSTKSVGPRMKSWRTPALGILVKTSHEERLSVVYYWENTKIEQISDLKLKKDLSLCEKTSMSNPVKSLGYIKCYSLSSHRSIQSTSNCIRYNCYKICSWSRRPKTILEIRKRSHFADYISPFLLL